MKQAKWYLVLHVFLGIYALSSVLQQTGLPAGLSQPALLLLYGCMLAALVAYAFGWQQVIKQSAADHRLRQQGCHGGLGHPAGSADLRRDGHSPPAGGGPRHHCGHCALCAGRPRRGGPLMTQAQLPYLLLYLFSTFLASVSQVLLKKAALREHKSLLAEYTDWRVLLGYGLFVGCTLLTMLAYKGVPLNVGPVLEATAICM